MDDTTQGAHDDRQLLRRHGLRLTAPRLAVLRALTTQPHSTADEICALARLDLGTVSRQAVYDVLAAFTDKGIVRRVQPAGSAARYEGRVGDNHHHLICRSCGRMVDVDCAVGDTPCLAAADDSGYEIDEAEVVYWGRCPDCQTDPDPGSTQSSPSQPSISQPSISQPSKHTGEAPT